MGVFLPVLPTVPFILLAAFCFARSSERLYLWLHQHPLFSQALADWHAKKAMKRKLKCRALILSGISFSISILLVPFGWLKITLFIGGIALMLFLWRIPVIEDV